MTWLLDALTDPGTPAAPLIALTAVLFLVVILCIYAIARIVASSEPRCTCPQHILTSQRRDYTILKTMHAPDCPERYPRKD